MYLQENPCKHPVIILRDSSYDDIEGLVRYVYRGEVDVQPEQLQSFLRTAELLQIKGLADQNLCNTATESESPLNSPNRSSPDEPIVSQEDDKKRIRALSSPLDDEAPVTQNRNQGIASPNIGIHQQINSPGGNIFSQQITQQSSNTSGCNGTNGKHISTSQQPCIKVPVPPTPHLSSLKRTNFTNLAQYLSGSSSYQSVTSPSSFVSSADGDNIDSKASNIQNIGGSVAKRRKVLIFLIR